MRVERKTVHEGRVWHSVPAAARLLRTKTVKVREIMGPGDVEWTQLKAGAKLLILVQSLLHHEQRLKEQGASIKLRT